MPTVAELTALYENFLLTPRHGPGVCRVCFNFTRGYELCYACAHGTRCLDAVAPISYSVAHEQLHHALAHYKRLSGEVARRLGVELAAVLWRFLTGHERCIGRAAEQPNFQAVTTVPSGEITREDRHPLQWIVSEVVEPTRGRYERLLRRSTTEVDSREFSPNKFVAAHSLHGESVLLIDDTWTTGTSAQSAAASLKAAGAGKVAAVVIGRHVNRDWHENDRRLHELAGSFDWAKCALCSCP
jgi:predicted amidophosphoribosyltransferase